MKPLRLVIVDDSPFIRKAIQRLLATDSRFLIVGSAMSGEELLQNLSTWSPDVITLDLSMPGMGGLLTLDKILAWKPIPVIIFSTHSTHGAPLTIEALHRGAVDFIDKQEYSLADFSSLRMVLTEKLLHVTKRTAGTVEVDHDLGRLEPSLKKPTPKLKPRQKRLRVTSPFRLVLIGASTGGPPAIQTILESLGTPLPVPIIIVQHMPLGYTAAFAERLNNHLPFSVREASQDEQLQENTVYIAPSGQHLKLKQSGSKIYTILSPEPRNALHLPSIDVLFQSVPSVLAYQLVAVLLTGMGRDGAEGLAELCHNKAYTIGQDENSSVVYGMPRVAAELGATRESLDINLIGPRLRELIYSTQKTRH